ncbi:MAG: deoxyribose-phosphate aldolase [Bacteroidales bacterium]
MNFICPEINEVKIHQNITHYLQMSSAFSSIAERDKFILNCIDHTSLEGTDNPERIQQLCRQAKDIRKQTSDQSTVASVCVYPIFAETAKQYLTGTTIDIACVAGAFPSGQSPLHLRVAEAEHAVKNGATEIDMVISRGHMLAHDYEYILREVQEFKKTIGNKHLKVILETGELQATNLIQKAAEIAIQGGADFIKTSTGKIKPAATLEAFYVMLDVIRTYSQKMNMKIGIKPAGGISDTETAGQYVQVLYGHLGNEWMNKDLFRIGASRLTRKISENL